MAQKPTQVDDETTDLAKQLSVILSHKRRLRQQQKERWKLDPLPGPVEMRRAALEWAMNHRGGYTGQDLKEYLAALYKLSEEQLARTKEDGTLLFANYVDWVTAEFTDKRIHTGWNGRPHQSAVDLYFLTTCGYAVGQGKTPGWPTNRRKGSANAKPDPRQLTETQLGHQKKGIPLPNDRPFWVVEELIAKLKAIVAKDR
jgi:hypothetical protein